MTLATIEQGRTVDLCHYCWLITKRPRQDEIYHGETRINLISSPKITIMASLSNLNRSTPGRMAEEIGVGEEIIWN